MNTIIDHNSFIEAIQNLDEFAENGCDHEDLEKVRDILTGGVVENATSYDIRVEVGWKSGNYIRWENMTLADMNQIVNVLGASESDLDIIVRKSK